jgi:hypothetical protein
MDSNSKKNLIEMCKAGSETMIKDLGTYCYDCYSQGAGLSHREWDEARKGNNNDIDLQQGQKKEKDLPKPPRELESGHGSKEWKAILKAREMF